MSFFNKVYADNNDNNNIENDLGRFPGVKFWTLLSHMYTGKH